MRHTWELLVSHSRKAVARIIITDWVSYVIPPTLKVVVAHLAGESSLEGRDDSP
jgi:hypothetical protein